MKIAFVIPWYGENIPGGAETECRATAENLQIAGMEIEILTTCVKEFLSDWNTDYYKEGLYEVNHIPVRRFSVRKRDTALFDSINYKLMQNQKISLQEEEIFIRDMINSDNLYSYIREHGSDYDFFLFIPYMFGTTYYGSQIHPEKSIIIPCLHDESYAYLSIYKKVFRQVAALIFHSDPEKDLANRLYQPSHRQIVLGEGIDTAFTFNPERFRKKYKIFSPFILYAGRKESGKNVPLLLDFFMRFKQDTLSDLKLVIIGSGNIRIPAECKSDIIDLGFVSRQDKYDAYAAATILCQPSVNESFSIVIMESWLCETPVLVHGNCAVTRDFCVKCNGGLYFTYYYEFKESVQFLLDHFSIRKKMGQSGKQFVLNNFSWEKIVDNYKKELLNIKNLPYRTD
ncbi:MAG: glycosyltransferase family 4 protein [Methanoregula sp.]